MWAKPSLGLAEWESLWDGSTANNLVGGLNGTTGTSVFRDAKNASRWLRPVLPLSLPGLTIQKGTRVLISLEIR